MRLPGWFFHQTWSARSLEQKKQISIIPGNKEITNSNLRYRFIFLLNNCNILLMKWWRRTLILSGYTACSIDTIRCPNELRSQRSRVVEATRVKGPLITSNMVDGWNNIFLKFWRLIHYWNVRVLQKKSVTF